MSYSSFSRGSSFGTQTVTYCIYSVVEVKETNRNIWLYDKDTCEPNTWTHTNTKQHRTQRRACICQSKSISLTLLTSEMTSLSHRGAYVKRWFSGRHTRTYSVGWYDENELEKITILSKQKKQKQGWFELMATREKQLCNTDNCVPSLQTIWPVIQALIALNASGIMCRSFNFHIHSFIH